jgi:hypothetical protein
MCVWCRAGRKLFSTENLDWFHAWSMKPLYVSASRTFVTGVWVGGAHVLKTQAAALFCATRKALLSFRASRGPLPILWGRYAPTVLAGAADVSRRGGEAASCECQRSWRRRARRFATPPHSSLVVGARDHPSRYACAAPVGASWAGLHQPRNLALVTDGAPGPLRPRPRRGLCVGECVPSPSMGRVGHGELRWFLWHTASSERAPHVSSHSPLPTLSAQAEEDGE